MSTTARSAAPTYAALAPEEDPLPREIEETLALAQARGKDTTALSESQRAEYLATLCRKLRLNPLTQPLRFLRLQGGEVLYATRGATDQLAAMHRLNRRTIRGPEIVDIAGTKVAVCVCEATLPDGRSETAHATLPVSDPANLFMKLETKAKRRATLSILGLGILDETELDTIPGVQEPAPALDHPPVPPSPPPTGSAWDEYRATVLGAGTVSEIRTAYAALPTALRLEGRDPAVFVGDAAHIAGDALVRLGLAVTSDGRRAILSTASETALDLLDELRELPAAVEPVASWWTGRVPRTLSQQDADLVLATAARWAAGMSAPDAAGTRRALAALRAAIDAAAAPESREPGDESEAAS